MRRANRSLSIVRSLVVIGAVAVVTTGVSFAALQSPNVSLTSNIINSGSADLRISKDGSIFTVPSTAGFTFDGVVPGGSPVPAIGNNFYLKNYGSVSLALKVGINISPTNLNGVDLSKTYLIFSRTDVASLPVTVSVKALQDSYAAGGTALGEAVANGATASYTVKALMDSDAYTGSSASITGINLVFIGIGT